jgi:SAM-dependent methyltransferase
MTKRVDYDRIAAQYESRYERNDYSGFERALMAFGDDRQRSSRGTVLEVGCGTGHWIRLFRQSEIHVVGLDPSEEMLKVARTHLADSRLIRARAEALPFPAASFERIFCVNALHHFSDPAAFFREARRVLVSGGGLLTVGLDPHTGRDRWWIYDYFPTALVEDRRRYLPAARIRELMQAAGFSACETREAQHMPAQMTVGEAERRGFLDRTSTSQLMVISDAEYEAGMDRIRAGGAEAILCSDLRVSGTAGWVG